MKVVFNTYPYAFQTPGGGEIQLLKTKKSLEAIGTHVDLYDMWNPQLSSADIVHFFSVFGGSSIFCNFVKQLKKPLAISSVLFPHQDLHRYPMDEIRFLLTLADIVFPNSVIEAELLAKTFEIPIEKFHVVYNGIDDAFLNDPSFDQTLFRNHFDVKGDYLLCVGNIEERKNQIALVKALASTDHQLILLGNIRDQAYFDRMMSVGNGKIRHLGYLAHDSELLRSAYLGCSAFVLPSLLETPGLAALEAAAMGAKLVITEVGSTREYFQDFAHYVQPDSESSILKGIQTALDDKASVSLKQHVRKSFPWANTAKQTKAGYEKIYKKN